MKGLGTSVRTYSLTVGVQKFDSQFQPPLNEAFYSDHMSFHGERKVAYEYDIKRKF